MKKLMFALVAILFLACTHLARAEYDPVSGQWLSYDPSWNDVDPNGQSYCGGDPINNTDANGRCIEGTIAGWNGAPVPGKASSAFMAGYMGGGVSSGYYGTLFTEGQAVVTPSTYINGATSFGNNINTVYQSDGLLAAGSYAATSWNVGAVWSGAANINLATGQPVGDWTQRGVDIAGGVGATAGIAAGGLGIYNSATAPATMTANVPPVLAPAAEGTAGDVSAATPVGMSGNPINVMAGANEPATINGIDYSGHALDQMQGRGVVPSVVQNTVNVGQNFPTGAGTVGYFDAVNNIRVIVSTTSGKVVTVIPGAP